MENNTIQEKIMSAIKNGEVAMRPRWHFILMGSLVFAGAAILLVALLYVAGLSVFMLRQNGAWFAPGFGPRGWLTLLESLPWILMSLAAVFVIILEILVRRYSFVYHKQLWYSLLGILGIVMVGGIALGRGPFEHGHPGRPENHFPFDRHFESLGPSKPRNIHEVAVLQTTSSTLVVEDIRSGGTSTIIITPYTQLPKELSFSSGTTLLIFGESMNGGAIEAQGIQEF